MALHKKKIKKVYTYKCGLTGRSFKVGAEAPHPDELLSVEAFYEMHPEKDDRPEHIKKQRKQVTSQYNSQQTDKESDSI